jgi:ribonuclease III
MARKPSARDGRLETLQARMGYRFANGALLTQALTHLSAVKGGANRLGSYQRLEFLGDRVLGVVVAAMLHERFLSAEEGELSRRFSELVRKETCANIARQWDVGPALVLGDGESHSGGRKKIAILGDAFEALLGAVFMDGGYAAAEGVIQAAFSERIASQPVTFLRDGKTMLQEWVQGRGHPAPLYREIGRSGPDHSPSFEIEVTVLNLGAASGHGRNKRLAEQAAAEALLRVLGQLPQGDANPLDLIDA